MESDVDTETESRQSTYEICVAWPVALASGRAQMVMVGGAPRGENIGDAEGEVEEEVDDQDHDTPNQELDQDTDEYAGEYDGSDCGTIGQSKGQGEKDESMWFRLFWFLLLVFEIVLRVSWFRWSRASRRQAVGWMGFGCHILTTTLRQDTGDQLAAWRGRERAGQ